MTSAARTAAFRSLRTTAVKRRRQRGAAIVEALTVSTLLIVMMACGIHLFRAYSAKYAAVHDARMEAWTRAQTCGSQLDPGSLRPVVNTKTEAIIEVIERILLGYMAPPKAPGQGSREFAASSLPANTEPGRPQLANRTMTSQMRVVCNETTSESRGVVALAKFFVSAIIEQANRL